MIHKFEFHNLLIFRNKLIDIDSNILALSMELERQSMVVSEWEAERTRLERCRTEHPKGPNGEEIIDMDTDKEKGDTATPVLPFSYAFLALLFQMF